MSLESVKETGADSVSEAVRLLAVKLNVCGVEVDPNEMVPKVNELGVTETLGEGGGGGGAVAPKRIEKSSMARPSSAPLASTSTQRSQKIALLAMDKPVTVKVLVVRFAAAFPSFAPMLAVWRDAKSNSLTSAHVPVDKDVALSAY